MNIYETRDEMDPRTNAITTATDAPPGVVLVRIEEYDRLREALEQLNIVAEIRELEEKRETRDWTKKQHHRWIALVTAHKALQEAER